MDQQTLLHSPEGAPGREKNRIEVTVKHAGMKVALDPNLHQTVGKLLEDALKAFAKEFNLQPPPNSNAVLRLGDRDLTDTNQTIRDAGVPDGAELELRFNPRAG